MSSESAQDPEPLRRTPLYDLHKRIGAKMVPFAGFELPIQYGKGILEEHRWTRSSAGLFDVSHMGQFEVRSRAGLPRGLAVALETLSPTDFVGLRSGRQVYGVITNELGGIVDDFIAGRLNDRYRLVANGSRRDKVASLLNGALSENGTVEFHGNLALLALQGPASAVALERLVPGVRGMKYMDVSEFEADGAELVISRSGYTGEDGFEISMNGDHAESFASRLIEMDEVEPAGLGARDSLRLEKGFCLYGNDIDEDTSPVEAGLAWTIGKARKQGGDRAGGYPGFKRIDDELGSGPIRRRVGLVPDGRVPLRSGTPLFEDAEGRNAVGKVTSGGFGPSVGSPISICYLDADFARDADKAYGNVRGKFHPARIVDMPFLRN